MRSVLLLGATGLIGRELLALLLNDDDVSRVVVIARRASGATHAKLEERVLDLDRMHEQREAFAVDQIFCALGTTIKVAGSQERFRAVDHDYPFNAAKLGKEQGAKHYLLVSAMGANASSRIFYNRVKGDVENDIAALNYDATTIVRPSLLLGDREEVRRGERIAEKLAWLMPPKYKPNRASDVAKAMVKLSEEQRRGVKVVEARELRLSYAR